ncbi:MAG: ferritin-like domain-containing protein [Planctomycetes bacterium]|nr:ferritin-like domain-containing protein [Planctomycetota bacterium]
MSEYSREVALSRLNELLAEELEASIRYLHLGTLVQGIDRLVIQKVLQENHEETVEHAQQVSEKILQVGGTPKPKINLELTGEKCTGIEALQTALLFEQAALDAYKEFLEVVEGSGDVVLEEFARQQVALESEHVSELQMLLGENVVGSE